MSVSSVLCRKLRVRQVVDEKKTSWKEFPRAGVGLANRTVCVSAALLFDPKKLSTSTLHDTEQLTCMSGGSCGKPPMTQMDVVTIREDKLRLKHALARMICCFDRNLKPSVS